MVYMLASNSGVCALAVAGTVNSALILESCLLSSKGALSVLGIAVVKFSVLNGTEVGSVLLGKNLPVLDWLDGAMVVILVHLLVNGSVDLLMLVRLDGLIHN